MSRITLLLALTAAAATGCRSARPATGAAEPPVHGCPADARPCAGHWYKAFDEKLSWHEAKQACEAMGGYLACIESAEEQQFAAALADGRYLFLGATDETQEDDWRWINGSPFAYTAWMEGQPNNWGGDEHYLATYDEGEWVDVAADGDEFWMPTGYLCEWESPPR